VKLVSLALPLISDITFIQFHIKYCMQDIKKNEIEKQKTIATFWHFQTAEHN